MRCLARLLEAMRPVCDLDAILGSFVFEQPYRAAGASRLPRTASS